MNKAEFETLRKRYSPAYQYVSNGQLEYPDYEQDIKGLYFLSNNKVIEEYPFRYFARNLQVIIFEEGIEAISEGAFEGHRCTTIVVPDSVTYLGSRALFGKDLLSITAPKDFWKDILSYELFNEFHLGNSQITYKVSKKYGQHLYIKSDEFDYDDFKLFDYLSSIHISAANVLITCKKPIMPELIDDIYVANCSLNYEHTNEYLKDMSGNVLFVKIKEHIVFGPWYTSSLVFPAIQYMPRSKRTIKYDIAFNSNFHWDHDTIKNVYDMVVYIRNKKKILLTGCRFFAPNVLINHHDIEELVVINYDIESFDVASFIIAMQWYEMECEKDPYFRKRTPTIIVPTDSRFAAVHSLGKSLQYLNVKVADVDEPDEYIG